MGYIGFMYYLKIKLNNNKIILEKRYVLESLYKALDSLFEESLGLEKKQINTDEVIYCCKDDNCKNMYADIVGMCISLRNNSEWFVDNVLQWELHSPDEGVEDLIEILINKEQ